MKKVTVKDVAQASGYSISTVSKVFNGTDRVGEAAVRKIRQVAKQLGYRSSMSAQSVAGKRRKIAVVLFESPKQVRSLFEHGFHTAFDLYGEFGIEPTYYFYNTSSALPWEDLAQHFDGVIITPSDALKPDMRSLEQLGKNVPLILLQTKPSGLATIPHLAAVTVDAYTVGAMSAQFLSFCCPRHARVGILVGYQDAWIHAQNTAGFLHSAKKYGLYVEKAGECFDNKESAYMRTEELLKRCPDLSGLFVTSYVSDSVCRCLSDHQASGVKVVGVDLLADTVACLRSGLQSAAIFQNQAEQAQTAVHLLVDHLRGAEVPADVLVKPELVLSANLSCYGWPENVPAKEE